MKRVWCLGLLIVLTLTAAGCRGDATSPGQVEITSTDPFKRTKGMKSPPPKVPTQR